MTLEELEWNRHSSRGDSQQDPKAANKRFEKERVARASEAQALLQRLREALQPFLTRPETCDNCSEPMPCLIERVTPQGAGCFCHRCRGEQDADCVECGEGASK